MIGDHNKFVYQIRYSTFEKARGYQNKKWVIKNKYSGNKYVTYDLLCSYCRHTNAKVLLKIHKHIREEESEQIFDIYLAGEHEASCELNREDIVKKENIYEKVVEVYKNKTTKVQFIKEELVKMNVYTNERYISQIIYDYKKNPTIIRR